MRYAFPKLWAFLTLALLIVVVGAVAEAVFWVIDAARGAVCG